MASPDTQNGTQVAVRQPVALGAPQSDFDTMYRLASNLSKAQLLPQALRGKPADVLILMMYGQELGLSPVQSLQAIYVVNGKPQLAGQLWLAKVRAAGHRVKIEHGDDRCTTTITRGDSGEVQTETFTLDDAKKAGLVSKDTWKGYPKRMLMWRSVSDCASVACPEVALGFGVAEVAEDSATRGGPQVGEGGGSPLAGVVGAASAADPASLDAALASTPAAQPDPAPAPEPEQPAAPSQDDLAEAYQQINAQATGGQGDDDGESDEDYQRRIWGDQYVETPAAADEPEQPQAGSKK